MGTRPIDTWAEEAAAINAQHGDTAEHHVGHEYLFRNLTAPKYVWVPVADVAVDQLPAGQPESTVQFGEQVGIHCHGRNASQAYEMRNNIVRALVEIAGVPTLRWLQSGWRNDRDGGPQFDGAIYVLNVQVTVPVPDEYGGSVEILGVEHEGVMGFESGDEPAC